MVEIVWSDLAIEDLKSILAYIRLDSEVYAKQQVDKIIKRIDQLISFPESGRIVPEFSNQHIRELIEGNYRIVYFFDLRMVSILRIHHSSRRLKFLRG